MSNVSGIGDAYYWSVFKIAEAFGLHRDTVKKRLLAANTPVAATVRGNPVYALQHVGPALFSVTAGRKNWFSCSTPVKSARFVSNIPTALLMFSVAG